jgi:hypothetical protein
MKIAPYVPDPWGMRWGKRLLALLLLIVVAEIALVIAR